MIGLIINEKDNSKSLNYSLINRGTVVWIEFGFNVGNEFGGRHPAVILRRSGSSAFVVPLSSKTPKNIQDFHVRIDKVYNFAEMQRWANVLRIKDVSINRIDFNASIGNVKGKDLDNINIAINKSRIF